MPQSLANLHIHLVLSTKDRRALLSDQIRPDLHAYMATVLANLKSPAHLINSVEDHIHVLFNMSRTITLAGVVEDIKKSSSKWLNTKSPELSTFSWQAGYGAFSVSESQIGLVANYVSKQEEHHRKFTFQDELRELLVKNNINYDEKYLWD